MSSITKIIIFIVLILNLSILSLSASAQNADDFTAGNAPALSADEQAVLDGSASKDYEVISEPVAAETGEDSKVTGFSWYYAAAPVFPILLFLAYLEIKRTKEHKSLMAGRQQHIAAALRDYVLTNLRKGYSKEQIKNALIKNNYSSQEVEEAFRGI